MPLTRLDNLISSKTGKYLYVSPDDFNATDALSNRGNSPITPFKSIQRAFLEIARYSYLPGFGNDRFDQFSIMLMPGIHYIDNRPGLVDATNIDAFDFDQATNAWTDNSILDISNPDNVLYKFNNTEGGAIIPRGSSLVGYDLRRTVVRPLYVPDPATTEREIPRSAIFNVTGGCYFWQFTIKDGQTTSESPLYDTAAGTGKVYYDPTDFTKLTAPNYSHHKLTVFEYADQEELGLFYRKIAKAFEKYQPTIVDPGEFDFRIQENRIVGPLSDSRVIESLTLTDNSDGNRPDIPASTAEITVTTKVDHGYFQGQFVAIANTEIDDVLEGIFPIISIDQNDPRKFTYQVPFVVSAIGSGLSNGESVTQPTLGANAQTLAEVDSVESASPYVFNVSIRSTWGICGIWANGLKATGFKSMVIAQYTGVSLQKDDRAFIRYDEYSNTWNRASLVDAFATVPYHTKGDSYWKDEWRNFHVRASEDAFIQNVSIFAVGFADHFLMESGGDMSITNSNSNFGNTSLHAIGFKGFAFNQDKGGYITDIIPPKQVIDSVVNTKKINYYTIDIQGSLQGTNNYTKLFLGSDDIILPTDRPAATIDGFRLGAKSNERLYVKLDPATGTDEFFSAGLEPTGFVKYLAKGSILNPTGGVVNSVYADAANLIESNRRMIQEEVFGYILEKYPRLQNISYVNPGLNPAGNRYFDARNLILDNRQQIVNETYDQMVETFGLSAIQGAGDGGKCKRDIGLIVDAVAEDLRDGGNANIIDATKRYFDGNGQPLNNGLVGEEDPSIFAFNRAKDLCKKAIANLLDVKADIYDPDPNSIFFNGNTNKYPTFIAGKGYTGSEAEEAGLTTNGVTYDPAGIQDPAGRNKDARNRIVANREFILDAALAEVSVYHPDFYIPGDTQTNSQSRLADAFRLIRRNSSEIRDKALASIPLNHPDFYIPGDNQTDDGSRYADAYRLIQQNKDQIVDSGLAQIAIGHPDFYIPGDQQTDERSRYADGYRLIQQNRTEIVNTAYANMLAQYPNYDGNGGNTFGPKCKRDIGIFIDAVSLDLFVGGNKYSRKFITKYFDATGQNWISGGLQGEEAASIEAFNQARDLMGSAVSNQLSITDTTVTEGPAQYGGGGGDIPRTNTNACDDVQSAIDTLTNIITTQIAAGNLTGLPAETSYIAGPGESKCRRDIGYFVDAVSLDLFKRGNVYTWRFCAEYFENVSTQISDGLLGEEGPSKTAFAKAAEMMKQAITNKLYVMDLTITADNAPGSDYGQVTRQFTPHNVTYDPATGVCVFSIANHDLSVGDRIAIADNSITFTCAMDGNNTQHTVPGQSSTVTWGGKYIAIDAVTADTITCNVGASGPNVEFSPTNATYDPATGVMEITIGAHTLSVGEGITLDDNSFTFTCALDNNQTQHTYPRPGTDPFAGRSIPITAVTATTITVNVGTSSDTSAHTFVSATANAVNHLPQSAHTFVSAATNAITFAGNTDNQFNAQDFLCSDVQAAIDNLNTIVQDVFTAGNLSSMPTEVNYGYGMGPGESKCARDIGYFIDAVSVDMFTAGNRHTKEFTRQYFTDATTPLNNGLVGEETESVTAFTTAIAEMRKAVYNGLYYKDLTVTEGNANYSGAFTAVGTPTNATYDPATGASTITIVGHGLSNGDQVKFKDNSFTFTCDMDGNVSQKTYPRQGDGNFDTAMVVSNVTADTFDVNVGTSLIVPFNVTAADYEPTTGDVELTIGAHDLVVGESIKLVDESLTFTCAKDNNQTQHSYPRTLIDEDTITTADYEPVTGVMTCTVPNHGWKNGDLVKFDNNSVTFTCALDNNQTQHSYPRAGTDPFAGKWIKIYDVTSDRFRVQVGSSSDTSAHTFVSATTNGIKKKQDRVYDTAVPITAKTATTITINVGPADSNRTYTPSDATYDPTTGLMEITLGANHGLDVGEGIVLADNSFTFTCALDNNATQHTYPRPGQDPYAGKSISITAKTATTITVNVGTSSDTSAHTFVSAANDAVIYSPLSVHTFVSATAGAVRSGGNYPHTFVSAATDAVVEVTASPVDRQDPAACSDVQTAIDNLGTIVTDAITNGNISGGIWNSPDNVGTFITGEAKCRRDIGHIVDAVAQDVWFGGNEYTIAATKEYFKGNSLILNGVDNEVGPSITAFKRAEDLMQRALNNQYYDRDLTITLDQIGDPTIVGDIECDAHDMVIENADFIAEEAYLRMLAAYPTYTPSTGNTAQDCKDDVVSVLKEVMWDVKFGGNSKTYDAAKIYVTNYDYRDGTTVETFIDAERDEAAKVMLEAKNIAMQVIKNETVTTDAANTLTQKIDNTIVEDWDAGELLPRCGSAVAAVDTLMGIIIQAIGNDGGVGTLTATRTTGAPADPAYDTAVNVTAVTTNTITFNVGTSTHVYPHTFVKALPGAIVSGGDYDHRFVSAAAGSVNVLNGAQITPTNATYDATNGLMTLYFGTAHGLTSGAQVSLDDNSIVFKCAMDNYTSAKSYPRAGIDPYAGQNIAISNITSHSFAINVGTSPLVEHNVSTATYDPASGDVVVTTSSAHGLSAGRSIKIKTESLTFTCTKDQNVTTHSYPRAARAYQPSAYADGNCSDVLATVNSLIDIVCDAINAGNLDNLPPLSNGLWDCANVRSTIENLFDILTDAISGGTLAGLPPVNTGDFTINNEASKCFRDVSYIVDAVVNDLRLGGNLNSIQAGEAYYVGNSLTYIDGERTETTDAWKYVGQLATAAMRNFDVVGYNCSTTTNSALIDVNDTRGIVIGMSVVEYLNPRGASDPNTPAYVDGVLQSYATPTYTNIPEGAFVKRIVSNSVIEIGVENSRLNNGLTVNAQQTSNSVDLHFEYAKGVWADTLPTTVTVGPANTQPDVIADTLTSPTYRECSGTADAIETLIGVITTIIDSGLGSVVRQEQTVDTTQLASRATVFTIDTTGTGPSNPHNFETGTPVRLVPRPRFDSTTGKYVDVDKRLVRLPNGFETNRTYYVIAPGRSTLAGGEDYSNTNFFNGVDQTKLMLATSKENACAGIYIYASETDAIDQDVEIDLYQFILDDKYDLHTYKSVTATATEILTEVAHVFDLPSASTTPQQVFIRTIEGGVLPLVGSGQANNSTIAVTDPNDANFGRINPRTEFFARYVSPKKITLHLTHADAINDANPVTFQVTSNEFQVFANKRRSPFKFDPAFTDAVSSTGKWYIQCKDEVTGQSDAIKKENIFWRINQTDYADRPRSTDMWYQRLDDTREADERTYKIRFVIPKYLENARDPINGFVLKTRTDDTRKLVPQKILLKPVTGTVYGARFENPAQIGERIGFTSQDFITNNLDIDKQYDPYLAVDKRAYAKFSSGIQATIQSGRYVEDTLDASIKYLELTVYDHTINTTDFSGLSNEILTTVKITAPQGGAFVANKTQNGLFDSNAATFGGNSSGNCNIHAYYSVGGDHYLIIKAIRGGGLEYSEFVNTRFTQGNVFADMLEDQDMGKSLPLKTLIRKNYPEYFYKQNGANVYTITPGDRIQDDAGVEYYVDKVEDAGVVEDTFYIFGYETLQRRIAGQQDGIYYITALRGNISPFPTGAGVTNNFKKFKFSQPVSKLYPLNFRNDPLWFKNSGTTQAEKDYYANLIDPPQAFSAADNYVHGLVTVNDFKNSVTRELVEDLLNNPAFILNTYTGDNQVRAQDGNATSGSEDRRIPIAGDSTVLSDQKYYIELRRPSIARAGNHTFEYLGFGPGNYSTGLPARQEVVLTPEEDFYAQSKKQDAGIVFYTGINSQGDLYIGNRRINAITGEETFIDAAVLADDGDEDDVIGGLVTTFDTPVTFNQNITVVGGDGSLPNTFESPVIIAVQDGDYKQVKDALIVRSIVESTENKLGIIEQDERLDRTAFVPPTAGDITLSKNKVKSAVFEITPIRYPRARGYKFFTHAIGAFGSNMTPNNTPLYSAGGTRLDSLQQTDFGGVLPSAGDILFKGEATNLTGSVSWIFADGYTQVGNNSVKQVIFDGTNIAKIIWEQAGVGVLNSALGITNTSQIRLVDFYNNSVVSGTWNIVSPQGDVFSENNNYVHIQLVDSVSAVTYNWSDIINGAAAGVEPKIEFSNSVWKELGVIGAEALRTETTNIGDFKLGINTVARAPHNALENAWTSIETTPRANLDVVGTTFISGRTTADFLDHTNFADRDKTAQDNALLVGGDSAAPNDEAVLRVATTNGGRVGINVPNSLLDRALVVDGTSRFTDDARFEHDIEVNGDDGTTAEIRTSQTSGTFNLVTDTTFEGRLNVAGNVEDIRVGNDRTGDTFFRLGNASDHSNIFLGDIADDAANISKIQLGGAYNNNSSNSYTLVGTKQFSVAGDVLIGANKTIGGNEADPTQVVTLRSEAGVVNFFTTQTQTLNFATNASLIKIGGQGGSTTVRNNFTVDANARFNADIKLCGGLASYSFVGDRAQLGTDDFAHASGELGNNTFNSNIDLVNVLRITVADFNNPSTQNIADGYNRVDTGGSATWGDAVFQETKTGAGAEGADLPAITGDEFYLPLKYKPTPYFQAGDYVLIDTVITGSGATERYPEIVRITEDGLQGAESAPYYIKVKRHPLGSFTKYKLNLVGKQYLDTHPDTTNIWKANISFDATWTTQQVDATGPQDNFYLSQFGGQLNVGDYVIVDREDTNNDGDFNQGEFVRVGTALDQIAKRLIVTSGCDTTTEKDVFVVDSVTGDIIIGDETVQDSVLNIYGSFNLAGGCGATPIVNNIFNVDLDTSDDSKLTLTNRDFTTFEVNTCNGNTEIGNEWGWVWAQSVYGSTAVAHDTNADVFVYTHAPEATQANGPSTTTTINHGSSQMQAAGESFTVASISGFQKDDLVAVIEGTSKAEIIRITADPFIDTAGNNGPQLPFAINAQYPSGGRAQEGTTAQSFTAGAIVVKILKDSRTTKLLEALPATGRTQAPSPNTSPDRIILKLVNGNLVAQKLDYDQIIRIGSEFFLPDSIDGNVDASFGVKMPKSIRSSLDNNQPEANIARYFGGGKLTIHDDLNVVSGNMRMYGTDSKTLIFSVANDDGHPGDGAILDPITGRAGLYLKGRADIHGNLRVKYDSCQENGVCTDEVVFEVDKNDGSVEMGGSFYHKGKILETQSATTSIFHIDNIGSAGSTLTAGPRDFQMYQDGSIDAFGISRYFNANGGRRWTYLAQSSTGLGQVVANPLQPNGNYLINTSSSGNMIVYLPSASDGAQTGDMIRFIDISGNLNYNANFILRANKNNTTATPIQGDQTGTKAAPGASAPNATAWDSGEMIVQTRNAAFGLVFVGGTDAQGDPNANQIPSDLQGWWLVEL